jgi:hypothetical protein
MATIGQPTTWASSTARGPVNLPHGTGRVFYERGFTVIAPGRTYIRNKQKVSMGTGSMTQTTGPATHTVMQV